MTDEIYELRLKANDDDGIVNQDEIIGEPISGMSIRG